MKLAKLEATGGSHYGQGPRRTWLMMPINWSLWLPGGKPAAVIRMNRETTSGTGAWRGMDMASFRWHWWPDSKRIFFNIVLIVASHHSKRPAALFPSKRVLLAGRLGSLTYIQHFEPSREPGPQQSSISVWRLRQIPPGGRLQAILHALFVFRIVTTQGTTSEHIDLPVLFREELPLMTNFLTRW